MDVLSVYNLNFTDWIPLIYTKRPRDKKKRKKKKTQRNPTVPASSASYLETCLTFATRSHLSSRLYGNRDDFNFAIITFSHFDSTNIPTTLPRMEFIFHNSYVTLELGGLFFIKTFHIVYVFCY